MSNSYLYNAPAGVVGDVTRKQETLVVPELLGAAFTAFGVPYKYDSDGKAIPIEASDAAAVVKGILSRIVPAISGNTVETFAGGIPNQEAAQGGVKRGFVSVICNVGTPVKGGQVWMRVTAATGKPVGSFETADAGGGATVALTGYEWAVSGKDANNITELYIK